MLLTNNFFVCTLDLGVNHFEVEPMVCDGDVSIFLGFILKERFV
jgi:hypothetical protein